jgi:enoyl-[acyl-carrier protein] reductase II
MNKKITELFNIKYPIVQGGMVWVSGAKLAAAASNAGILGLIGAGSMKPELFKQHILKAQGLTQNPFGVNLPLLYGKIEEQINIALEAGVKIFFTSAGSPKKFTKYLKDNGCVVVHVTSNPLLAKKCEDAGVDAIVAEGFEAGGHNGREELTTMTLIPQVKQSISIPIIAAGGIGCGHSMAAAFSLGADGVQIGSRFAATQESSAHINFKNSIIKAGHDSTMLSMKDLVPVRLLKNNFFHEVQEIENAPIELSEKKTQLLSLLGKGRAKKGMLEGDLTLGELEIGQVAGSINDLPTMQECVTKLIEEYHHATKCLSSHFS